MKRRILTVSGVLVTALVLGAALGFDTGASGSTIRAAGEAPGSGSAEPGDTGLVFRRMWSGEGPNFYASTPSQDGRYLTEIDWDKGELVLRDLLTGHLEYVTHVGAWDVDWSFPESSVLSPDGKQVAATWYQKGVENYEIRLFQRDGSGSRVLLPHGPDHDYSYVEDWSDDGAKILATLFPPLGRSPQARLTVIDVATGRSRVVKEMRRSLYPLLAAFSPDGRLVAYDLLVQRAGRTHRDIFVAGADGTGETAVVQGPSNDRLMGWSPDGSGLLFYSDRELTQGIWQLPMQNGRPAGEPQLLRGDVWGLFPLGFSRSAYFYGVHTETPQVRTVAVDIGHARQLTPVTLVNEPSAGQTRGGIWSPDGSQFAYVEQRPGDMFARLIVRSVRGDDAREFALEYDWEPLPMPTRWSADGRSILFWAVSLDGSRGYFRIDLGAGTTAPVATTTVETNLLRLPGRVAWNDDWTTYYRSPVFRAEEAEALDRIEAVDVKSGAVRVITTGAPGTRFGPIGLSPDGRFLAAVERKIPALNQGSATATVVVVPTAGGTLRPLHTEEGNRLRTGGGIRWTPDGAFVLFVRQPTLDGEQELVRVPVGGGDPVVVFKAPVIGELNLAGDGRWLAFKSGRWKGEVWMIEGLPGTGPMARPR